MEYFTVMTMNKLLDHFTNTMWSKQSKHKRVHSVQFRLYKFQNRQDESMVLKSSLQPGRGVTLQRHERGFRRACSVLYFFTQRLLTWVCHFVEIY